MHKETLFRLFFDPNSFRVNPIDHQRIVDANLSLNKAIFSISHFSLQ